MEAGQTLPGTMLPMHSLKTDALEALSLQDVQTLYMEHLGNKKKTKKQKIFT